MLRRGLAAAVVLTAPGIAHAQIAADTAPRVVVSISKTARVAPDRAVFYVTVEGSAETPPDAAKRAQQKLDAVVAAIRALDARAEGPTTAPYGIVPAPQGGGYPPAPPPLPYVARHALRIVPKRIDQIQEIAAAALAAGATSSSGPAFEYSASDSVKRALVVEAIREGERQADVMATALGGRRGSLVDASVSGGSLPGITYPQGINFNSRYDFPGQASLPDVGIPVTVTLRYRLVR